MATVRAKFKVQNIVAYDNGAVIDLHPVTDGSEENKMFYSYTPGGHIQLATVNAKAAELFHKGDEFYVDFTPTP